jgi:hypothetical protein
MPHGSAIIRAPCVLKNRTSGPRGYRSRRRGCLTLHDRFFHQLLVKVLTRSLSACPLQATSRGLEQGSRAVVSSSGLEQGSRAGVSSSGLEQGEQRYIAVQADQR